MQAGSLASWGQRAAFLGGATVVGGLALPVSAAFLDGPSTEHLIKPVQFGATTAIGIGVGAAVTGIGLGGAHARASAMAIGGALGLAGAAIANQVWENVLLG
ncbi:MAG: hypothetical protein JWM25_1585 [Thermoleophilia bacterium]|nr:hypothetical protein [Thermoleophilia bacterium]MCZ4497000.1 hypothetical protein [Thermoleophilia bacterium]